MPAADRNVDRLFELPLGDFVRARNDLVTRLRKSGRGGEAADVKRLAKPTPPTWIVNQLARRDPGTVGALVKAVDRLARAQLGDRDSLHRATEEQRAATHALLLHAKNIAEAAGIKVSPALMTRVSSTLLGTAVDPHDRENLRRGRLTGERRAPGFDAFTSRRAAGPHLRLVVSHGKEHRDDATRARPIPPRPSRDALRRARKPARVACVGVREHERGVAQLERDAERKRKAAARTERSAAQLRDRLEKLQARAAEERRAAEEAEEKAQRAREDAVEASRSST